MSFTSVEHIFPETLGNTEKLLPAGVVCDQCNNGVLSTLDSALCGWTPISMMKTIYGIETKAGKRPEFRFDNGSLRSEQPGHVRLDLDSGKWHQSGLPAPPGLESWSFTAQKMDASPKKLSMLHRSLVKIAVELAWLDHGEQKLLGSEFDHERDIVLHGGHSGYVGMVTKGNPEDLSVRCAYQIAQRRSDGHPFLGIASSFWDVALFTDTLHATPLGDLPEGAASILTFEAPRPRQAAGA